MRPQLMLFSIVLMSCLLALSISLASPQARAEQLARQYMTLVIGADAVNRAQVVVTRSEAGWLVMFRDAYATCDQGVWFPGACRFGRQAPYRDVYTCVPDSGEIGQVGASGDSPFGAEDPCQWSSPDATRAPALTATPSNP